MPPRRTKLAPGIWKDKYGIAVVVRSRQHGYREERFPLDTTLRKLKAERDRIRVELRSTRRRRTKPTTLAEDVPIYLAAVKALRTYQEREYQLGLWLAVTDSNGVPWSNRQRDTIQPHEIQTQRDRWRMAGKAAGTVNKYLRALSNLYRVLDPKADNPVHAVEECDEPAAMPRAIPLTIANAILSSMTPSKTRARLEVLATTGIEQATFAQLAPEDVDLEARTVRLPRRRKGKRGASARILPLTPAGVRAFKAIIRWDAWGKYSTSSVHKSFRAACQRTERAHNKGKPKAEWINLSTLRPKDLRHTFGTGISLATGGNTATIQQFLGHATPVMADRYRLAAIPVHLREATAQMSRKRLAVTIGRARKTVKRLSKVK